MRLYPKIQTIFHRDPATKHKTILKGQWSLPEFAYLTDNVWTFTEKVDGTNVRIRVDSESGQVEVGGRTDNAQLHTGLLQHCHEVGESANGVVDNLILCGEGYGEKIQSGGKYREGQGFILFDVMTDDGLFLAREDVEDIAAKIGVPAVPIVGTGTLWDAYYYLADGFQPLSVVSEQGQVMEGLVMRPQTELRTRRGERVIAKLKVRDFA